MSTSFPPLFLLSINDGFSEEYIYEGRKLDSSGWVLLSQFQDGFYVYSWSGLSWVSVAREKYNELKNNNAFLEIRTSIPADEWLTIPMTNHPKSKSAYKIPPKQRKTAHKTIIHRSQEEISLNDLDGYSPFEVDNLPPSLRVAEEAFLKGK